MILADDVYEAVLARLTEQGADGLFAVPPTVGEVPGGTDLPTAALSPVTEGTDSWSAKNRYLRPTLTLTVSARTFTEVKALALKVRQALEDFDFALANGAGLSCRPGDVRYFEEATPRFWRAVQDMELRVAVPRIRGTGIPA